MLSLADFSDIKVISGALPGGRHLVATKDNLTWHIVLRHGLYSAQVDVAVSNILRKVMPDIPQLHIVQDDDEYFYVASVEVPKLIGHLDKNTTKSDDKLEPKNYGTLSVWCYFLGESDIHSGQYLKRRDDADHKRVAIKIDNAESLDQKKLQKPVSHDKIFANHWDFDDSIINHHIYLREQKEALKVISLLAFDELENEIRNTVTASKKEELIRFSERILELNSLKEEKLMQQVKQGIEDVKSGKENIPTIDDILGLLRQRQKQFGDIYCKQVEDSAKITYTPSFAQVQISQNAKFSASTIDSQQDKVKEMGPSKKLKSH